MNKLRIASFVLAFAKTCDNEEIENAYDSPFPAHNEGTSTIQTVALSKVESHRKDDRRGDSSHNIIENANSQNNINLRLRFTYFCFTNGKIGMFMINLITY